MKEFIVNFILGVVILALTIIVLLLPLILNLMGLIIGFIIAIISIILIIKGIDNGFFCQFENDILVLWIPTVPTATAMVLYPVCILVNIFS